MRFNCRLAAWPLGRFAPRLVLRQPDMASVIGIPRELDEITLSLTSPQRQFEREMEMLWRLGIEGSFLSFPPDEFGATAPIKPARSFAGIGCHKAPVKSPCQGTGEDCETVVRGPLGSFPDPVSPGEQLASSTAIAKG
jgi:hypothetical protein